MREIIYAVFFGLIVANGSYPQSKPKLSETTQKALKNNFKRQEILKDTNKVKNIEIVSETCSSLGNKISAKIQNDIGFWRNYYSLKIKTQDIEQLESVYHIDLRIKNTADANFNCPYVNLMHGESVAKSSGNALTLFDRKFFDENGLLRLLHNYECNIDFKIEITGSAPENINLIFCGSVFENFEKINFDEKLIANLSASYTDIGIAKIVKNIFYGRFENFKKLIDNKIVLGNFEENNEVLVKSAEFGYLPKIRNYGYAIAFEKYNEYLKIVQAWNKEDDPTKRQEKIEQIVKQEKKNSKY